MSKHSAAHKNYVEVKSVVNGAIMDKIRIPSGHFKKVNFSTKVVGTDRLFLVSEQYALILEKFL